VLVHKGVYRQETKRYTVIKIKEACLLVVNARYRFEKEYSEKGHKRQCVSPKFMLKY
jgi:hypothetical protein